MRKYLIFHIKDSLPQIILFSVIAIVCSFALSLDGYIWTNDYYHYNSPQNNPLELITSIAIILSIIVPITEFSYRMRKITVDQMYSFPIKREKLFISHYISGLIKIIVPVTVSIVYFLIDLSFKEHLFEVKYFFPYYLSLIGTTILGYNLVVFLFMRGNTVGDGLINIAFGLFFIPVIIGVIYFHCPYYNNISENFIYLDFGDGFIFRPIIDVMDYFKEEMEWFALQSINIPGQVYLLPEFSLESVVWLLIDIMIGIAAFVLSIVYVKKDKSEDSMGISNSWFSYKFMLPFYLFAASYVSYDSDIIIYIFLLIGGYLMYVVYRRTFKIKIIDIILIISCVVCGAVSSGLMDLFTVDIINEAVLYSSFIK